MYDPRAWRALARGPEYVPPHTSIHQGAPIRPPPPYHAPTADVPPPVSTNSPSSHVQGPPSPSSSNKLSRPQGFASSSATSKSPNGKFGGGHRQKPHLVFPLDARPVRASKTLTKLLDKLEDDQKRDIHTRISGHLNHDKVFEGLVKSSQNEGDGQQQRRGRRGRPAANSNVPSSIVTIPLTPPSPDRNEDKPVDPFPRPHTPPRRSTSRPAAKYHPFPPAPGSPMANGVISAVIHQKIRNPDRASILYHQYLDEVQVEPTPLGKMHVASRYFDVLIQDFRLFAPLLSGIKTAYHDVVEQYITDLNELEALKRGLIVSIARHQAKAGAHDQLIEQVTQLQHEKDELAAQVRTLEQMLQHSKDSPSHGTLGRGAAAFHAHLGGHGASPPPPSSLHAPAPIAPSSLSQGAAAAGPGASPVHAPLPTVPASVTFQSQPGSAATPPMSRRGSRARTGSVTLPASSLPATAPALDKSPLHADGAGTAGGERRASVGSPAHGGSRPESGSERGGGGGGESRGGTRVGDTRMSVSPLGNEVVGGDAGLGDDENGHEDGERVGEITDGVGDLVES